ncbi:MAG: glycosyltransferase family 2 protein [Actinomycetales bacterium]|nr:glycosyltransferase family 2 protein [Actinomycetales bacterium]
MTGEPVGAERAEVGCVVLSMGDRPVELTRALRSVLAQRGVSVDCLVVGNGWEPTGLPAGVRGRALPENIGIPGGRNEGVAAVRGDVVLFLDDDAELVGEDFLARARDIFAADPSVGLVQPLIADPQGRPTPTRWVPRLRGVGRERAGDVAVISEGVCLVRRAAFDAVGGWAGRFFYAHEGIELTWQVMNAGYRARYEPSLVTHHPAVAASRHEQYYYLTARNRIWVARRNLPVPLALVYVAVWGVTTLVRLRGRRAIATVLRGFWHGVRQPCGARRPISWRTAWRMTRAGRPPIV